MSLPTYWEELSPDEKKELAKRCDTSVAYLSQVFHGHRKAGWRFAQRLSAETKGAVTCGELRPEIFGEGRPGKVA